MMPTAVCGWCQQLLSLLSSCRHSYDWVGSNYADKLNSTSFGLRINGLRERDCGITKQTPRGVSKLTIDKAALMAYLGREGLLDEADN